MNPYSELQLDALRELANIGSGTAGTALSTMLGKPVDLNVPSVRALPVADAVEAMGDLESIVTAIVIPLFGDMDAVVTLLFTPEAADTLCSLLGVEHGSDLGVSALQEIGNILGTSYVGSIVAMTGLHLEPRPPQAVVDMLGALLESVFLEVSGGADLALVMDSALEVEGEACSLSFVLVPSEDGVSDLLDGLGMAG